MNYGLEQVSDALETFYSQGYEEIEIERFTTLFCKQYQREKEKEKERILRMLRVIEKSRKNEIKIKDGHVQMWNVLGGTQRARIITIKRT